MDTFVAEMSTFVHSGVGVAGFGYSNVVPPLSIWFNMHICALGVLKPLVQGLLFFFDVGLLHVQNMFEATGYGAAGFLNVGVRSLANRRCSNTRRFKIIVGAACDIRQ